MTCGACVMQNVNIIIGKTYFDQPFHVLFVKQNVLTLLGSRCNCGVGELLLLAELEALSQFKEQ